MAGRHVVSIWPHKLQRAHVVWAIRQRKEHTHPAPPVTNTGFEMSYGSSVGSAMVPGGLTCVGGGWGGGGKMTTVK